MITPPLEGYICHSNSSSLQFARADAAVLRRQRSSKCPCCTSQRRRRRHLSGLPHTWPIPGQVCVHARGTGAQTAAQPARFSRHLASRAVALRSAVLELLFSNLLGRPRRHRRRSSFSVRAKPASTAAAAALAVSEIAFEKN